MCLGEFLTIFVSQKSFVLALAFLTISESIEWSRLVWMSNIGTMISSVYLLINWNKNHNDEWYHGLGFSKEIFHAIFPIKSIR